MPTVEWINGAQVLQPYVYGGVALAAVVHWRRHSSRASAWLAVSFGVLGVVVVAGQLIPEGIANPIVVWVGKTMIALLVLFPYFLYRFIASFIRPIRLIRVTAATLTAGVAVGALILPAIPETGAPRPAWLEVYVAVVLIQWTLLSGFVAFQLWGAGRRQPTVVRRRMRTMSVGAAGLALALVLVGESSSERSAGGALAQLIVLAAAPLMLVGFAPPYFLRSAWRKGEESALKDARLSLMGATTSLEVARALVLHARMIGGAQTAFLEDDDGHIVASDGEGLKPTADVDMLDGTVARAVARGTSRVSFPLSSGRLTVIASPFTPFFGQDEISSLEGLAALADLALARSELFESHRRLAEVMESSDDAVISTTLDGTITSWNRGAETLYGYGREEAIGRPLSIIVPSVLENEVTSILERMRRRESIEHYETIRQTKDGKALDVSLTISPLRDAEGNVTGSSSIARDVTERKKAEIERESAREAADRANRAKSEFLSRMSHELRTPLNGVLGFAQLLDMDPLTPEQKEATTEIIKAGRHLLELIDEMLDISRVEAGTLRLSLEPVDAVQAIQESVSLLGPLAHTEGITLDHQGVSGASRYVNADRRRLKQVLLNLISNAIKYNRRHGSVRVTVEPAEHTGRLQIDVTDTGHGIASDRLGQLFAPFERLDAEVSGIEGTGLGLTLSKSLVEAMGGSIVVASEVGKGTTFSVELLLAEQSSIPHEDVSRDQASPPTRVSRTILYIEDNLSNLKLVERLVARRPGIDLVPAMQGRIGVTLAREHLPSLILLDLHLPDIRGEEVLARLQADPQTAEVPVVVLSADATPGQSSRLLDAGARAYLAKPIDAGEFLQIVDEFCASQ